MQENTFQVTIESAIVERAGDDFRGQSWFPKDENLLLECRRKCGEGHANDAETNGGWINERKKARL